MNACGKSPASCLEGDVATDLNPARDHAARYRRMLSLFAALACVLGCTAAAAFQDHERTPYGGRKTPGQEGTGYFRVAQVGGRWWLVDPAGGLFFSKGVNHISFNGDHSPALGFSPYRRAVEAKYATEEAWAKAAVARLRSWGFNTVGAWSSRSTFRQGTAYTLILNLGAQAGANWLTGSFPDVFSDEFRSRIREVAARECVPLASDPYLIGYFTDNELAWGPDWRRKDSLLVGFLKSDPETAGHKKALEFLRERYDSARALGSAWQVDIDTFDDLAGKPLPRNDRQRKDEADFQYLAARQYFRVCYEVIREFDTNHLVLGCRFAGQAPQPVLRGAGEYTDIISFNSYAFRPPRDQLTQVHEVTGRAVMLTEFSFKAMDSGLPNTRGAGRAVQTQQDRADGFEGYVTRLAEMPFTVGYHWFQYTDQPAEGRFDGENSNFGLVKINDEPWDLLVERMTQVNVRLDDIHLSSAVNEWPLKKR